MDMNIEVIGELAKLRTALENINETLLEISSKMDNMVIIEEYVDDDETAELYDLDDMQEAFEDDDFEDDEADDDDLTTL